MIRVRINLVQHTQCSNMTSMTQRQESLEYTSFSTGIHIALEKLKMTFSSRPIHRRTILKDWEIKCMVATKQHRGVHNDTLHQSQNTNSLRDTRGYTARMVVECEPTVKLAHMETPDRTKSPWGWFTVLDLLKTKAVVLWGFSIMHQWSHHSWTPAKPLLREAAKASNIYATYICIFIQF